jgi:hypothetical protein
MLIVRPQRALKAGKYSQLLPIANTHGCEDDGTGHNRDRRTINRDDTN